MPLTDGESIYEIYCAKCHNGGMIGAPSAASLGLYDEKAVVDALDSGTMNAYGKALSGVQIQAVASFLTDNAVPAVGNETVDNSCTSRLHRTIALSAGTTWDGWGSDLSNSRHVQSQASDINHSNVSRLKLKWVFATPSGTRARAQPAVTSDVVYLGTQNGTVYALDTQTGCEWWSFEASSEVRSAISIGLDSDGHPEFIFFGDMQSNVYSVHARTGKLRWKTRVGFHSTATITGSLRYYERKLYVPVSSSEGLLAVDPEYACCTFRGSVVALDAASGKVDWRSHIVPESVRLAKNRTGTSHIWGPSGAPVWSVPTIDVKRGLLYVGSGQNYTMPATKTSDSIIAMNLQSGEIVWATQATKGDAWNLACYMGHVDNCPIDPGPDYDFGAPAILHTLPNGSDILLAGQKSGMVFGIDPDNQGKVLWKTRVGRGGYDGGVHWGMTADKTSLYIGVSDYPSGNPAAVGTPFYGIRALDPASGAILWSIEEPVVECDDYEFECTPSVSAAITSVEGVVFTGGLDGILRAYSTRQRKSLWEFDSKREYPTVNGARGFGGSIDSDGPVVLGDMLFVNSGYDKYGEIAGNVLLVFSIDGE